MRTLPNTIHKDKLKRIKDLNVRPETIKLLEENIGRTLDDTNQSKIPYDPPPRVMEIKIKVNKWDIIKLKSFCTAKKTIQFSSVQSLSHVRLCDPMNHSTPGLPVHHQLPEFTQTHVHWVSDDTHPSHPLSSPSPPAFNLPASGSFQMSQLFASGGQSIGVPASTSILPMNTQDWSPSGWTGWISLQSKGLSSLLQHHSSKASILQCSAFFIVQVSYPYMTTGKIIALTKRTFVGKVMSLLFNMLSRLVITFLPRSKHLLISWLQSPSDFGNYKQGEKTALRMGENHSKWNNWQRINFQNI